MIEKVISGGQIGADIAGLRAAKKLGIETGGWATLGFRTLIGPNPLLATEYGLRENDSTRYADRTFLNVRDSDATVRIAQNFDSRGERCTLKAIRKYEKQYFDISMYFDEDRQAWQFLPNPIFLAVWLDRQFVKVLNVAGNANKDLEDVIEVYLTTTLETLVSDYHT